MPAENEPRRPNRGVLLTDAHREHFVAALREHYAAGTLTDEDFSDRIGVVLAARHVADAAAAVSDLPPLRWQEGGRHEGGAPERDRQEGGGAQRDARGGTSGRGASRRQRRRGHAEAPAPDPGWLPTAERFRDPTSGRILRVWVDPVDGSRRYVPDDTAP